jgi:hypothetical protein
VFGMLTGFTLSVNEILYYVLSGPIAILGGFLAGVEHRATDEGVLRGAVGGLIFGSFILLGNEILSGLIFGSFILLGNEILNPEETKAHLPDPQSGLVLVTALGGAILGGLGARWRSRQERRAALSG